ncbi:putative oxidoreductase CipA [Tothia fuscella]|uniref:Oxidoreductase CipA n=1 Tax=Tothia fuscella TaxID=1048955 RepID=A0A9P4NZ36_9PEZI|nr:putative oxidoreductase CipA [Tothia fuscella]
MSFANQRPAGFKNYVERIAIVGAGGQSGGYMVAELLKAGKKVSAITREDSTSKVPEGVEIKRIKYEDQSSIVEALKGQEVLIITMSVMAPPEQQRKLIEAAAAANVPWVLPNEFGNDNANVEMRNDVIINSSKTQYRDQIEKLGVSSWIGFACNFWYEYSLGGGHYGIDIKNRKATFYDDGKTRLNTTTFAQVGRGVAGLLNLKVLPDSEDDKSPCLSNFKNKFVYVSSFCVNQEEMLESIKRVTNTADKDWQIEYRPISEVFQEGLEKFKSGDRMGMIAVLYGRNFFKDDAGNYEKTKGLQNDVFKLPKEDLDEATKIAVQRAEEGKRF